MNTLMHNYMSRYMRKPTLWPLHNVLTLISLHSPHRLIWVNTFLIGGYRGSNDSWNRKSTGSEKFLSRLACAACSG